MAAPLEDVLRKRLVYLARRRVERRQQEEQEAAAAERQRELETRQAFRR